MATPTLAGFLSFIRDVMQVPTAALPDNSPIIPVAFNVAVELVYDVLAVVAPNLYELAVYNLGGSNLVNYAPDLTGASPPNNVYWSTIRKTWGVDSFVAGVVQSTSDEGTSMSLLVPDALSGLTLSDLQYLKDPYGRAYLRIAQSAGPLWGLT